MEVMNGFTPVTTLSRLEQIVREAFQQTKILDMHTHLFPQEFEELCMSGVDELLNYHYLVAEAMRHLGMTPEDFWQMTKAERADVVWQVLFVDNMPVSEATMGILTILQALGISDHQGDLNEIRHQFNQIDSQTYIDTVFKLANVDKVVMTNDPLDERESALMNQLGEQKAGDPRFLFSLRLDRILNDWPSTIGILQARGYQVNEPADQTTCEEVARFLEAMISRWQPVYLAVSLPHTFRYPDESAAGTLLKQSVLPLCREHNMPLALMVGTRRQVNPRLMLAGDSVGRADVSVIEALCRDYPQQKFLVTMLSRENQYELTVLARKFSNLMIFGCWWFLNTPAMITEITEMRLELLGNSFIPQHSDCRVLEQLIYKWRHSIEILEKLLTEKYSRCLEKGWRITEESVMKDIEKLVRGNFISFINK